MFIVTIDLTLKYYFKKAEKSSLISFIIIKSSPIPGRRTEWKSRGRAVPHHRRRLLWPRCSATTTSCARSSSASASSPASSAPPSPASTGTAPPRTQPSSAASATATPACWAPTSTSPVSRSPGPPVPRARRRGAPRGLLHLLRVRPRRPPPRQDLRGALWQRRDHGAGVQPSVPDSGRGRRTAAPDAAAVPAHRDRPSGAHGLPLRRVPPRQQRRRRAVLHLGVDRVRHAAGHRAPV
jgi:hypothetical protein